MTRPPAGIYSSTKGIYSHSNWQGMYGLVPSLPVITVTVFGVLLSCSVFTALVGKNFDIVYVAAIVEAMAESCWACGVLSGSGRLLVCPWGIGCSQGRVDLWLLLRRRSREDGDELLLGWAKL